MKSTSNCCGGQCSLKKCCDVFQVLAWNLEPGISVRQSGRVTYLSLIFQYQFACSICGATSSRKSCIFSFHLHLDLLLMEFIIQIQNLCCCCLLGIFTPSIVILCNYCQVTSLQVFPKQS